MAALTANLERAEQVGRELEYPVAVDIIYRGALLKQNAAGFVAPCAAEAGAVFAGIAYEKCDNSGGSAGDKTCRVIRKGVFPMAGAGFTQADVGSKVYASDDQTVSTVQGANEQEVGTIVKFDSATQVRVAIDHAADIGA